ncbi:hypothetical protein D3C71_1731940 [compost metagenome]
MHYMKGIAHLVDDAEVREAQQGERRAPLVQLALVVIAHLRVRPVQAVGQLHLIEQLEERIVGLADEVVVTLDAQAVEIEVCRHATDAIVALVHVDLVALLQQLQGCHEAHRATADDGESAHLNGFPCDLLGQRCSTIWL